MGVIVQVFRAIGYSRIHLVITRYQVDNDITTTTAID